MLDDVGDTLYSIIMSNGNRTQVSVGGAGTGTNFIVSVSVTINTLGTKLYVTDTSLDAVFEVDLSSGYQRLLKSSLRI